jgi:hypothetical protein
MFAQATRLGLRFQTPNGQISVEDLWNLPISTSSANKASLESLGRSIRTELKDHGEETSLFGAGSIDKKAAKVKKELELKFEIVKFIGETLVREKQKAEARAEARQKAQRMMELIQQKKEKELEGKSVEELTAMLATIGDTGEDDEE